MWQWNRGEAASSCAAAAQHSAHSRACVSFALHCAHMISLTIESRRSRATHHADSMLFLAAALLLRRAVPLCRRAAPPIVASCAAVRLFSVTSVAVNAVVPHTLLAAAVNHAVTLAVA